MSEQEQDEREALAKTIRENRTWAKRMDDGYTSVGSATDEEIADAILAVFDVRRKTLIEDLTKLRDEYQADSFTAQAEHARWQERAEAAEQRSARMEAAIWKVFGHAHLSSFAMDDEVRRLLTSALEQKPGALPIDRIRAVTSDVIKIHEGNVSTHYETCYLFHAACLALLIRGLADDDKETESTIMHACDSSFGCALCGYTVCGNPAHSEYVPECVAAIKDHRARVHGMQTPWL